MRFDAVEHAGEGWHIAGISQSFTVSLFAQETQCASATDSILIKSNLAHAVDTGVGDLGTASMRPASGCHSKLVVLLN